MGIGTGGNTNDLTAQHLGHGIIFAFRVNDDDRVLAGDLHSEHLLFGAHGLTGTGGTEDEAVAVLAVTAIEQD